MSADPMDVMTAKYCEALARVEELEAAALECHSQLSGMSMGTEGYTRNLICRASNVLAKVLGKTLSSHGSDEYFQNYKSQ